jgi:hypothetical protein
LPASTVVSLSSICMQANSLRMENRIQHISKIVINQDTHHQVDYQNFEL